MLQSKKRSWPQRSAELKVVSTQKELSVRASRNPLIWLLVFLFLAVTLVLLYPILAGDRGSPTVINEQGEEVLAPERQAKLDRELEEIDNAVQYALVTNFDDYYPCLSCPDGSKTIFLYKGEVWKYGVTRKGQNGRYPGDNFGAPNLSFLPQLRGNYAECLKMEKIKIYNYPLLPEAAKRKVRLFRPPGNVYDN